LVVDEKNNHINKKFMKSIY